MGKEEDAIIIMYERIEAYEERIKRCKKDTTRSRKGIKDAIDEIKHYRTLIKEREAKI